MKICKYCGSPGRIDTLGREYIECTKCFKNRMSKVMEGKTSPRKGVILSKEIIQKISISRKGKCVGNDNPAKRKDVKEKISKANKNRIYSVEAKNQIRTKAESQPIKYCKYCSNLGYVDKLNRKHNICKECRSEKVKEPNRLAAIKRIEKYKGPIMPARGKNETQILNNIEIDNSIKLERQYPVIGYFLDGYDKENNTVYEVNEKHHFNLNGGYTRKHLQRKTNIINHLRCEWIEIDDVKK